MKDKEIIIIVDSNNQAPISKDSVIIARIILFAAKFHLFLIIAFALLIIFLF